MLPLWLHSQALRYTHTTCDISTPTASPPPRALNGASVATSQRSGFPPPPLWNAGKRFFDELDADKDGRINVTDLKRAMKARNLPEEYAYSFMDRAKRNPFARSIGYDTGGNSHRSLYTPTVGCVKTRDGSLPPHSPLQHTAPPS